MSIFWFIDTSAISLDSFESLTVVAGAKFACGAGAATRSAVLRGRADPETERVHAVSHTGEKHPQTRVGDRGETTQEQRREPL